MPHPIQAQPPLEFIPPDYNPWVVKGVRSLLPWWMRSVAQIRDIEFRNVATLAQLYHDFQSQKVRFLLAFRHPTVNDPYCLASLTWHEVPQVARLHGIDLTDETHFHFLYDRGIPLWAGKGMGWLYSRMGGTSIKRGGLDLPGLRSARNLFTSGRFPLAAAPEGATNGHSEIVSPIEPGVANLGFWCYDDLRKANRSEQVLIAPIGIQYHYVGQPWIVLERLLSQLEVDCGIQLDADLSRRSTLQNDTDLTVEQQMWLYGRLRALGERLLNQMEQFYSKYYRQQLSIAPSASPDEACNETENMAGRLHRLLDVALQVAEYYFNLSPKGSLAERCRRIEQAGWERIYRDDLKQIEQTVAIERGLADLLAEEAALRLWHMRLVESFVSVTGYYVQQKPTVTRFAETLLILWETIARIKGKRTFPRPQLGPQRAVVTVGEPIDIGPRWPSYQSKRRQAVTDLTQDLQTALEALME